MNPSDGRAPSSRADVARHDEDRVARIDLAAVRVTQSPFVEHLQEDVEHFRRGFLDFIEQHHTVRAAAQTIGQLTAALRILITGRRPDQPRDRMRVVEFGHIQPQHRVVAAEQEIRQRPRQFGLADARRAEEQEHPNRAIRIAQTRPAPS